MLPPAKAVLYAMEYLGSLDMRFPDREEEASFKASLERQVVHVLMAFLCFHAIYVFPSYCAQWHGFVRRCGCTSIVGSLFCLGDNVFGDGLALAVFGVVSDLRLGAHLRLHSGRLYHLGFPHFLPQQCCDGGD